MAERSGNRAWPLAHHFADVLECLAGAPSPELHLGAELVSRAVAAGHVCLPLADPLSLFGDDRDGLPDPADLPTPADWEEALRATGVVGEPGAFTPLILESGRLYLQRYWDYEDRVARFAAVRADHWAALDEGRLAASLTRLFPGDGPDGQRDAALVAATKPFSVLSGGPGTGKTSTVVKLLAALVEQRPDAPPRIALAAPTGKAAARLMDAIRGARDVLPCADGVRAAIPAEVSTVHRLLGTIAGSPRFRHDAANPLPHDLVVVDEASMVALPLLARLVDAITPTARLVLVGDHRQLASVDAGAVLGDLCSGPVDAFSPRFAELSRRVAGAPPAGPGGAGEFADCVTVLEKNYRFGADSGIGATARALWENSDTAFATLSSGDHPDVGWTDLPAPAALVRELEPVILEEYGQVVAAGGPGEALEAFGRFQLLCALRRGPFGVEELNRLAEQILARSGQVDPRDRWYRGRPVLVTRNDYGVGLFNGDVGVAWPDPERGGETGVFFPAAEGGLRSVSPARVPVHDTAYAMTVHKSQGSEFERVLLLLPDRDSPVLTRELLYTGITRARSDARVWGRQEVFERAAGRRTERPSGLGEKVWGGDERSGS